MFSLSEFFMVGMLLNKVQNCSTTMKKLFKGIAQSLLPEPLGEKANDTCLSVSWLKDLYEQILRVFHLNSSSPLVLRICGIFTFT